MEIGKELEITGVESTIRADLYKMLLYEEGAFFERHRDYEKAPGMFGTLVIALPSSHTGGDFETSFGGQSKTLTTEQASGFGYTYLSWYADVEHAVRPVISGYCLVLTYNLLHIAPGALHSAVNLDIETLKLRKLLSVWRRDTESGDRLPKMLAYMTEHKYTGANLRLDHLKGRDRATAQCLRYACEKQSFCFFLANLEHTIVGGCEESGYSRGHYYGDDEEDEVEGWKDSEGDEGIANYHEIDDIYETYLKLRTVFIASGLKLAEDVPIVETDIAQVEPFARNPNKEDYSGYTGNEGVSATHYYRNICFVVLAHDCEIDFLFEVAEKGDKDINAWMITLVEQNRTMPADERHSKNLERLCELVIAAEQKRKEKRGSTCHYGWEEPKIRTDETLGLVVKVALQLRNPALLNRAVALTTQRLPLSIFRELGERLPELGLSEWQEGLDLAIEPVTKLYERYEAATNVVKGYQASRNNTDNDQDLKRLGDWRILKITSMLTGFGAVYKEDGQILIEIAKTLLPFAKKHLSNNSGFSIMFLTTLFNAGEDGKISQDVVSNVYRDILCNLLPDFKLEFNDGSNKRLRYMQNPSGLWDMRPEEASTTTMTGNDIAMLIDYCLSLNLNEEAEQILGRISCEATTVATSAFKIILFPS